MKTVGIIAEYNPFHNGHAYQIAYARNVLHADRIVIVMSGCFTQRGTPALTDPWMRARMALSSGADLVILLPVVGATGSSREFSRAAAGLLDATGIVDTLLFGAEDPDMELFAAAESARPGENDPLLKEYLTRGMDFAGARSMTMAGRMQKRLTEESCGNDRISYGEGRIEAFLASPNNILGIEYVSAIHDLHLHLAPACMQRMSSSHNDSLPGSRYASSSAIRRLCEDKPDGYEAAVRRLVPVESADLLISCIRENACIFPEDLDMAYALALAGCTDYAGFSDCTEALSNRIVAARHAFTGFEEFCHLLKSKNIAYSRISRILSHILLGITNELAEDYKALSYAPYLYVAGVRESAKSILSNLAACASAPVITSPASFRPASPEAEAIFRCGLKAEELYRMTMNVKAHQAFPTPYERRLEVL